MEQLNEESKIFESKIEESSSEVDGVNILAKVVGEGFTPDGISRNGRFYPRALWERVCSDPELNERLNTRQCVGTIGHSIAIDDESFRKGEFSHIITKMYINESGKGIIEALVVNTPAGRVLNTFLRAGSKLYVSTRASGDILPNQLHEGLPIVDPSTYHLEGVDFVLEPGFLNASPNLVESLMKENDEAGLKKLEEAIKNSQGKSESESKTSTLLNETMVSSEVNSQTPIYKEDTPMNEDLKNELKGLNESLSQQNAELKISLNEATQRNSELLAENKTLKEQQNILNEEVSDFRAIHRKVAIYETLGTPEEIQAVFDLVPDLKQELASAKEQMDNMEDELGSAEEIRSALEKAEEIADELDSMRSELGSEEEIEAALSSAEEYISAKEAEEEELGSAEEIKEAFRKAQRVISEYRKLGTPREIKECMKLLNESIKTTTMNRDKANAIKVANKYGISEQFAYNLLKKGVSENEIATMCESKVKGTLTSQMTNKTSITESFFDKKKRASALMESFSR